MSTNIAPLKKIHHETLSLVKWMLPHGDDFQVHKHGDDGPGNRRIFNPTTVAALSNLLKAPDWGVFSFASSNTKESSSKKLTCYTVGMINSTDASLRFEFVFLAPSREKLKKARSLQGKMLAAKSDKPH